ncbi:MAG: hypothetical protein CL605_08380 [Altibacter sp.]|nr:hypothetical protein [Altibacter sp.]
MGAACAVLFLSCGTTRTAGNSNQILRQAQDTPTIFEPAEGVVLDNMSCKSPMIDTRNGTKIILVSSAQGTGDYRVVPLAYGLKEGDLLRLDCNSGSVLGIVKE